MKRVRPTLLAATLLVCLAPEAVTQQPVVAGTVVNNRSAPLEGARVQVVGTQVSATTDPLGRFRLEGVSGAQVQISAALVGYRGVTLQAAVGRVDLRIMLTESLINLEEVIVTGTPAGVAERRALGNSVSRIDARDLAEIAPAPDLRQLINARASGVLIQSAGGFVGQGSKIRIRGLSSLSLTNEPLFYVDGVRMDNTARSGPVANGRSYVSRLNDINPEDIESIEVIKGPAAATLYGTEASNGVIQIITKRGRQGKPRVTALVEQGANWIADPEGHATIGYTRLADGTIDSLNYVTNLAAQGASLFRTGHRQNYGMELSGGVPGLDYFISGRLEEDQGPLSSNELSRFTGRANARIAVYATLDLEVTTGYTASKLYPGGTGGPLTGFYTPDPRTRNDPRRGGSLPLESFDLTTQWQDLHRFTAGISLNHRPRSWFTQRLRVGTDLVGEEDAALRERLPDDQVQWFGPSGVLGFKVVNRRDQTYGTVDYGATARFALSGQVSSNTSVGAQYYRRFTKFLGASGAQFPAPGVEVVSGAAASIIGTEDFLENATLGFYLQQQFGWRDRLFLTAAVRGDDNSSFGEEFDFVTYPKVSGSWVMSAEPFWPFRFASTFRIRAAYGQSGQQPDAFAALTTYQPIVGPGGVAAVRPQFGGNPSLGPERGSEIELGFDASLFGGRVAVDFTFYDKRTKDAILAQPPVPSLGFIASQFVNIGEIKNTGLETQLNVQALSTPKIIWDLGATLTKNSNKILDMGGVPSIGLGVIQQHRKGFPVAGLYDQFLVSVSKDANGFPTNPLCDGGVDENGDLIPDVRGGQPVPCGTAPALYIGQITPKWEGAINSTLTLFNRLTLVGTVDFKTGLHLFDANSAIQCSLSRLCLINANRALDPEATAAWEGLFWGTKGTWDASFAKLRQLSLTYRLPDRWARFLGAEGATITAAARNLHTWTSWPHPVKDPEQWELHPTGGEHYNQTQLQLPQPRQFMTSLRLAF